MNTVNDLSGLYALIHDLICTGILAYVVISLAKKNGGIK